MSSGGRRPGQQAREAMARSTRFQPRHTRDRLIVLVQEVSAAANPDDPTDVSERRFDGARVAAGHADCPKARSIAERLGVSWRPFLRAVHAGRDANRLVSVAGSDRGRKGITLEMVLMAIRLAAGYLGSSGSSHADYERAREELVAPDRRAWAHGGQAEMMFPTRNQIDEVLDQNDLAWTDALGLAGLGRVPTGRPGLAVHKAVALFVRDTAHRPFSIRQLKLWGEATGHPIAEPKRADFDAALAALPAHERALPTWPVGKTFEPMVSTEQPRRRRALRRTPEEMVEGLVRALDFLEPGESLSQRSLRRISRTYIDEPIPSWNTVARAIKRVPGATWAKWRDEATRRHAGESPRVVESL